MKTNIKAKQPKQTKAKTVQVIVQYYEILDKDFTGVEITITEGGQIKSIYRNYYDVQNETIHKNQTETFELPSVKIARQFIESAGTYENVTHYK